MSKINTIKPWIIGAAIVTITPSVVVPLTTLSSKPGVAQRYKINLEEVEGGTFSVQINDKESNGQALACEGDKVTILPSPKEGFTVEKITLDGTQMSAPYEFTMPAKDVSVSGSFKAGAVTRYKITLADVTGGTFSVQINGKESNGEALACAGDKIRIIPAANSGYTVATVTLDGTTITAPYEFTMPAKDVAVSGTFIPGTSVRFKITLSDVTGGTFSVQINENNANAQALACAGDKIKIIPTPDSTYTVSSVTLDGSPIAAPYQFTMPAKDVTVSGTFNKTTGDLKVTFHPSNDTHQGRIVTGIDTEYVTLNTTFAQINKPVCKCDTNGYVFTKWYKDASCTTPFESTDKITANTEAYAGYVDGTTALQYGYYYIDSSNNHRWLYLSQTIHSFNPDENIWAIDLDTQDLSDPVSYLKSWKRSEFNMPITIGNKIEFINDDFLNNCSAFNQKLTIPASVKEIGQDFLFKCTSFNNGNYDLVLPTTNPLAIDGNFMEGCSSYVQHLTIPSNCNQVGERFMYGCLKFTYLTVNNAVNQWIDSDTTLAGNSADAPMYNPGISVYVSDAAKFAAFLAKFPKLEGTDFYRNLVIGA